MKFSKKLITILLASAVLAVTLTVSAASAAVEKPKNNEVYKTTFGVTVKNADEFDTLYSIFRNTVKLENETVINAADSYQIADTIANQCKLSDGYIESVFGYAKSMLKNGSVTVKYIVSLETVGDEVIFKQRVQVRQNGENTLDFKNVYKAK